MWRLLSATSQQQTTTDGINDKINWTEQRYINNKKLCSSKCDFFINLSIEITMKINVPIIAGLYYLRLSKINWTKWHESFTFCHLHQEMLMKEKKIQTVGGLFKTLNYVALNSSLKSTDKYCLVKSHF